VSRLLQPWSSRPITAEQLLGTDFLKGHERSKFRTKEEWEEHKRQVTKMARFHSKVLRQMRAGERKAEKVMQFPDLDPSQVKKKREENGDKHR